MLGLKFNHISDMGPWSSRALFQLYNVCGYLFMLGLKVNHISDMGPWSSRAFTKLI